MSEVQATKDHIANFEKLIDQLEPLERLAKNRDFKKLILDGFCNAEVVRYMEMYVAEGHPDPSIMQNSLEMAKAGVNLKTWMVTSEARLNQARSSLKQHEQQLDDLMREGIE